MSNSNNNSAGGTYRVRKSGDSKEKVPSHLKGKEIGLYFRDQARKKKEERMMKLDENYLEKGNSTKMEIGLKGKEIGLYFRDQARKRKEERMMKLDENYLEIGNSIKMEIESLIRKDLDIMKNIQFERTLRIREIENIENLSLQGPYKMNVQGDCDSIINESLYKDLLKMRKKEGYKNLIKFREKLPAYKMREKIVNLISQADRAIFITGETGCGKTTQVPQLILDDWIEKGHGSGAKILCTQPRRISTIAVAERVASERGEKLGDSIGYQIRLEKVPCREYASILFCTTGMLLQFMRQDPNLENVSHVIIDEIHERSTESDILLALLKNIQYKENRPKIILMSATMDHERFITYFDACPTIHIPGFTYPVKEFFLEDVLSFTRFRLPMVSEGTSRNNRRRKRMDKKTDEDTNILPSWYKSYLKDRNYTQDVLNELRDPRYQELSLDLVENLIRYICETKEEGAILVFLPGIMDIMKLKKNMLDNCYYQESRHLIIPLHSRMPTIDQKTIFEVPEGNVRKIILSTSIAESSITIEDVVYVIDSGRSKYSKFDVQNNYQTLLPEMTTLANAHQRRGRAGRVKPGECYHLYNKLQDSELVKFPIPEIMHTRLEQVILQLKILKLGKAKDFLSTLLDPPILDAIDLSLKLLRELDVLDENECLTPFGYHLAKLPLDPRIGKMIIWAALFSCVEPVFAIAASLSFKDAFYCPLDKEDDVRKMKIDLSKDQFSDHIVFAEALRRYERNTNSYKFCKDYFLSPNTLKLLSNMKRQFTVYLHQMKFLKSDDPRDKEANKNSDDFDLVKAIVCTGLYPNIAIVKDVKSHGLKLITPEDERVKVYFSPEDSLKGYPPSKSGQVKIHPSSINEKTNFAPTPYLMYYLKQRSSEIFLHDTTFVNRWALIFASKYTFKENEGKTTFTLSNSLTFSCYPEIARIIQDLCRKLDAVLEHKINYPGTIEWNGQEGQILRAMIKLLSEKEECLSLRSNKYHHFSNG